ncbi:unnamed protein product [Effrenium voratum]|uniref:Uncharacterized protein n=1 Tax=Effrenium voratum TaxID=2562239 RepID=A0AA36NEV9_9DINO|nr:unnamed protein product [Effrenium voratum]
MLVRRIPWPRGRCSGRRFAALPEAVPEESEAGGLAVPGWAKVAGGVIAVGSLLGFHYIMITQREQREAMYRDKIQTLHDEVLDLRSRLREAERARFRGKPATQSAS